MINWLSANRDFLAGIIILTGIAGGIMYKFGFLTFRRNGKINGKADHDLVIITAGKVEVLEKGQDLIFEKLNEMPEKIVGLLKDTKGLLD